MKLLLLLSCSRAFVAETGMGSVSVDSFLDPEPSAAKTFFFLLGHTREKIQSSSHFCLGAVASPLAEESSERQSAEPAHLIVQLLFNHSRAVAFDAARPISIPQGRPAVLSTYIEDVLGSMRINIPSYSSSSLATVSLIESQLGRACWK